MRRAAPVPPPAAREVPAVAGVVSVHVAVQSPATDAVDQGHHVDPPRDARAGSPRWHAEPAIRHRPSMLPTPTTADDLLAAWS